MLSLSKHEEAALTLRHAQGEDGAISLVARYSSMSLEITAIGIIVCLLALFALMPSFDGDWD